MKKADYSILISVVLVFILLIRQSSVLWPGTFFLILQCLILFVLHFVRNAARKRGRTYLLPVFKLYQTVVAIVFPVWILLAVTGQLTTLIGRIYVIFLFILFFALILVFFLRLLSTDLLDRFK